MRHAVTSSATELTEQALEAGLTRAIISPSSPRAQNSWEVVAGAETIFDFRHATVDGNSVDKDGRGHGGDHENVEVFAEQHLDSLLDISQ